MILLLSANIYSCWSLVTLNVYLCVAQCSASCDVGYQQRIVSCSVMPSSQALRPYAAAQSSPASTYCPEPHPPGSRPCLLRDCPHTTYWKVGPWSKVKQKALVRQGEIALFTKHFDDLCILMINLICGFWANCSLFSYCFVAVEINAFVCIFVCIPVLTDLWGRSDGAQSGVCDLQRPTVQTLPSFRKTGVSSCMSRQRMSVKLIFILFFYLLFLNFKHPEVFLAVKYTTQKCYHIIHIVLTNNQEFIEWWN